MVESEINLNLINPKPRRSDEELLDFVFEHFDLRWDEFDAEITSADGGVFYALDREDLNRLMDHVEAKEEKS